MHYGCRRSSSKKIIDAAKEEVAHLGEKKEE